MWLDSIRSFQELPRSAHDSYNRIEYCFIGSGPSRNAL